LNHKNYVTKIAETMIFDKSGGCTGAGLRYIHIQNQKRSRSGIGTAATDLASVAGASPRNFRLAGSTV
jgi:hypothetical protein